jgi:tetratricopeptide (TPR) repeat protein
MRHGSRRCGTWAVVLCLVFGEGVASRKCLMAQAPQPTPASPAVLSAEAEKERNELHAKVDSSRAAGKWQDSIGALKQMLELEHKHLGEIHSDPAGTLQLLAECQTYDEDFAAAQESARRAFDIQSKLFGKENWRASDIQRTLNFSKQFQGLTPQQRDRLRAGDQLDQKVADLFRRDRYADAIEPAGDAVALYKEVLGPKHLKYADAVRRLGIAHNERGALNEAEPLLREALAIHEAILGISHPESATTMNHLAGLYEFAGKTAKAQRMYRQVQIAIRDSVGGRPLALRLDLEQSGAYVRGAGRLRRVGKAVSRGAGIAQKERG